MMEIKEIEIDNEKVYIKKGIFGYRIVHPIKENSKINWINLLFGGYSNLFKLGFIVLLIILLYIGVNEMVESCKVIANDPCSFCKLGVQYGIPSNIPMHT